MGRRTGADRDEPTASSSEAHEKRPGGGAFGRPASACAALLAVMSVLGCRGAPRPVKGAPTAASTAPACVPSVHQTEDSGDPNAQQRYRIVGASADGRRIAVVYSYIGPGSGAPFAHIYGYEAGTRKLLFHLTQFAFGGSEADLAGLEEAVLKAAAGELEQAKIAALARRPEPEPWCLEGDRVRLAGDVRLTLTVSEEPCVEDTARKRPAWKLCSQADGCAEGADESWACISGALTVLDVYRINGRLWTVVDMRVEPFQDVEFHLRRVGGL